MRKEMKSQNRGLYSESFEHDNCGIGAIVNFKGKKTHCTVAGALSIVEQLEHRAGKDAEGKTGDGVGILTQIPHGFFKKVCQTLGIKLKDERDYGVCMFFLPQDELKRNQAKKMFEVIVNKEGMEFLGWREVPTDPTKLGQKAVDCMPYIMQGFVKRPAEVAMGLDFEIQILSWLFAKLGFLSADFMRKYRKHANVDILVVAAIITPTSDVFTLALVSLPIWILYETSILLISKMHN